MPEDGVTVNNYQRCTATVDLRVSRRRCLNLFTARPAAHRLVADDLAVLAHRRDVGDDPVETAVLAPVLDDAAPRSPGLEVQPHIVEGRHRHVRVAHHVVRLPDHFLARIGADVAERLVSLGDDAFEVGA